MRMLLDITIPHEPFNTLVRKGTVGAAMEKLLKATKAEAVYFSEKDGKRGAMIIVNIENDSDIPGLVEPWFLTFNADCKMRIAMTPEDLAKSGIDKIGKTWK